jgi:hypothetical protein
MTFRERLDAANAKFDRRFGGMDDEWTEMYGSAASFAHRLLDGVDDDEKAFVESVICWLEKAADAPQDDEDDSAVILKVNLTVECVDRSEEAARKEAGSAIVKLLNSRLPHGMAVVGINITTETK